jgi:hypothetical protein
MKLWINIIFSGKLIPAKANNDWDKEFKAYRSILSFAGFLRQLQIEIRVLRPIIKVLSGFRNINLKSHFY